MRSGLGSGWFACQQVWEVDLDAFLQPVRTVALQSLVRILTLVASSRFGYDRRKYQTRAVGCNFGRDSSPEKVLSRPGMECLQKIGCCLRHIASPQHTRCQGVVPRPTAWLFLLALLLTAPLPLVRGSESAAVSCVYANSSNSQCSSLCPQGCFYSFLPSYCSEEGLQVRS